ISLSNSATAATPMPLNKDWREFLELLNSNGVEYLVVGAFAVALSTLQHPPKKYHYQKPRITAQPTKQPLSFPPLRPAAFQTQAPSPPEEPQNGDCTNPCL